MPDAVFDIGFPLYEYIPHNDVLRIWAKTGTIGFALYWLLNGAVIVQGTLVYRRLRDRRLKVLAIFAVCLMSMELVVQYVDMAMTLYRSTILVGLAVGVMLALERIERQELGEAGR